LPFRNLWLGETPHGYASVVMLENIKDKNEVINITKNNINISYIDTVSTISDLFREYREYTTKIIFVAHLLIYLFLSYRFGFLKSFYIILPPALSVLLTITIMIIATDIVFNIFTVLSLLIVLGIGIDYSIFYSVKNEQYVSILLATALSSATTVLSFGLLFFSETPVLKSFGFPLFIGIILAFILAPIALRNNDQHSSS
jgi:predicted exporter